MEVALIVVGLVIVGIVKVALHQETRCIHCGPDNGLKGWDAQVCPACGRNKTVLGAKAARKR